MQELEAKSEPNALEPGDMDEVTTGASFQPHFISMCIRAGGSNKSNWI